LVEITAANPNHREESGKPVFPKLTGARGMSRIPKTIAGIAVATLAIAAIARAAEEPTRESYVAQVETICKRNVSASQRILKGASERIKKRNLGPAGRQFIHVSIAMGNAIKRIAAVPRPAADDVRLRKWIKFLGIVKTRLRRLGGELKAGDRLKATHESINIERSSNAANNVGFVFGFHYCRLTRSRFR
jgi:hypothetical protein